MELQLGLALSTNYPATRFDLNAYAFNEPSEPRLSPCLSSESSTDSLLFLKKTKNKKKKRCLQQAFDEQLQQQQEEVDAIPPTLPLFWNTNQPNEEDDPGELDNYDSSIPNDGDEEGVVGWPPIKAWRRKLCHRNRRGRPAGNEAFMVVNVHGGGGGGGSMSRYVKVKMEGVGIARKVDLRRHDSYQMLMDTLVAMFGRGQENRNAYKLTYQDRDGHWLHAGDVPWSCFIGCVQRLKLERRKR